MRHFTVHIHGAVASGPTLDPGQLAEYVKVWLPQLEVVVKPDLVQSHLSGFSASQRDEALKGFALQFARAKVRNPLQPRQPFEPMYGEIDYEARRLSDPASRSWGLMYDGVELMHAFRNIIPEEERSWSNIHVVFTDQLIGTWEDGDKRYHARVSLNGFPSILSTTGLIEAPAKPRDFYLLKQQYVAMGLDDAVAVIETQFKDKCISHDDPRLTEVMKGYVMQALAFHFWGEPFCPDKNCRLYNAHRQQEVIAAQLKDGPDFCPAHTTRLKQGPPSTIMEAA